MSHRAALHFSFTMIAATALAGCFEPLQSGGVMIVGDPSERVGTLCRFRRGSSEQGSFCANDEEAQAQAAARVKRMASAAEGLKGPYASGREGDFLLENDEIAVVISQPANHDAPLQSGGHIIDAGNAKGRADALRGIATAFGSLQHQPAYDVIVSGVEIDGSAWVEVAGHDSAHDALRVRTRYTLAPGARALTLTTTLENADAAQADVRDLGDVVCWGGAAPAIPAAEPASTAAAERAGVAPEGGDAPAAGAGASVPYLFGVGAGAAYALAGDGRPFFATVETPCSAVAFRREATIAPLAKVSYERLLVVAPRPDTAAIATELFFLAGGTPGGAEIAIDWDGVGSGRPNESRVALRRLEDPAGNAEMPVREPPALWLAVPAAGSIAAELAPGRYAIRLESPGFTSAEIQAVVEAGKVSKVKLQARLFDGASQIPHKE